MIRTYVLLGMPLLLIWLYGQAYGAEGTGSLRVTVLPVQAPALVSVQYTWDDGARWNITQRTDDGTYQLGGIPTYTYIVTVACPGYVSPSPVHTSVKAGTTTEVAFTLQPGATISGRVTPPDGAVAVFAVLGARRYRAPVDHRTGAYAVRDLPAGRYDLVVVSKEYGLRALPPMPPDKLTTRERAAILATIRRLGEVMSKGELPKRVSEFYATSYPGYGRLKSGLERQANTAARQGGGSDSRFEIAKEVRRVGGDGSRATVLVLHRQREVDKRSGRSVVSPEWYQLLYLVQEGGRWKIQSSHGADTLFPPDRSMHIFSASLADIVVGEGEQSAGHDIYLPPEFLSASRNETPPAPGTETGQR